MDAIFIFFIIASLTCATYCDQVVSVLEDFVGKVDSEAGSLLKSGGQSHWRSWQPTVSQTGNWKLMTGNGVTLEDRNTVIEQVRMVSSGIDDVILVAITGQGMHTFRISSEDLSVHAHTFTRLGLASVGLQAFYEGLTAKSYVFALLDNCSVTWYAVRDNHHLTPRGSIGVACDVTQLRLFTTWSSLHVLLTWPSHGPPPTNNRKLFISMHIAENANFEEFQHCVTNIALKDVRDVQVFQMNLEHIFLVFATSDNTLVYRYARSSHQVAPHQKLPTRGRSLKVVRRGSRSFLLVLGDDDSVATYEWSGQLFRWRAETAARGATGMTSSSSSSSSSSYGEGLLLTSQSGICQTLQWDSSSGGFSAFNLSACLTGADAHVISMVKVFPGKVLVAVPEELEDGTRRIKSLVDTLDNTAKLNEDIAYKVADLGARLTALKGLLEKVEDSLSFEDIVAEKFIAQDVRLTMLNGIHVNTFLQDAVTKDDESMVRGAKTWEVGSHLAADVEVTRTLNSIPKNQLLTRTTQQTVSGSLVFQDTVGINGDIIVAGKVNGVKLSKDAVRLSGHQMITGFKVFQDHIQVAGTTSVHGDCNGANLTALASNVLRCSVPQHIGGKKTFTSVNVGGDVTAGRFCGQDTKRLFGSAMTLDFPSRIFAPKTFTKTVSFLGADLNVGTLNTVRIPVDLKRRVRRQVTAQKVVIHGDLVVGKYLNGHYVPQLQADVILKGDEHAILSGTMTFTEPQLLQGTVSIQGPLNDANLQTDFVHRAKPNTVTGLKTFTGPVKFLQRMEVSQTIDGVDISQLALDSLTTVNGGTVGGRKTFAGGMTIGGKMLSDGIDVLAQEALRQVDSVIVNGQTYTNTLNKHDLDQWASSRVTLTTDQKLDGECIVSGLASSPGDVTVKGTLNEIYMDDLVEDSLRTSGIHQVVTGKKTFNGTVRTTSTFANKGINGFDLDNIADKSIKIMGNAIVHDLLGEDIRVDGDFRVDGVFNGVNFTEFAQDCVTRTDEISIIKGVKTFKDLQALDVAVRYGARFLTASTNQTITGSFNFCNDLTALQTNWNPPQTKIDNVIFKGSVKTKRLSVSQDGCHRWRRFFSDAVTNDEDDNLKPISIPANKTITGKVTFHGNLQVKHDNGVHFDKMAANGARIERRRKTFDVRGEKTFHSDVTIEGRVQVEKAALLRRGTNRRLQIVSGPLTIGRSITIDGNMTAIMKSSFNKGTMVFDEVHVLADVTAGTLNGIGTCSRRCDARNDAGNLQLEAEVYLDEPLNDVHVLAFRNTALVIASCGDRCAVPTRVYHYGYHQLVYKGITDGTSVVATHVTAAKMFLIARKTGQKPDAALWVTEDPNVPFARWASVPGNPHIDSADFYMVNDTLMVLITGLNIPPTVLRVGTRRLHKVLLLRRIPSGNKGVSIGKALTLNDKIYFLLGNPSLGTCRLVVPSERLRVIQALECQQVTAITYCLSRTSKGVAIIAQKNATMVYTFTDNDKPLRLERSIPSHGTSKGLNYNCQSQQLIEISEKFGVKVFGRKGESGFVLMTNLIHEEITDAKTYGSGRFLRLVATDGRRLKIYRP